MNTGPNFSASDILDPPSVVAWDSGNGALAICELLVQLDGEPAPAAADPPVRAAEERCQAQTTPPSSPGIVEEPWQRAEREQDRFYNRV